MLKFMRLAVIGVNKLAVLGSPWHRNDTVRPSRCCHTFSLYLPMIISFFPDEYKPTLKNLERILAEAGLDEEEMKRGAAAAGAGGGGGSGQSRNRR